MELRERIQTIMDRENLTPSLFADRLKVGRPVISHILTGRNNASLDIVTRILETFDYINTDWLILGQGSMLQGQNDDTTTIYTKRAESNAPNSSIIGDLFADSFKGDQTNVNKTETVTEDETVKIAQDTVTTIKVPYCKKVTKIILYYEDNSFQAFNPVDSSL